MLEPRHAHLERELAAAKADLADRLVGLRRALRERLAVKARARVALARVRQDVRDHRVGYAVLLAGVVALGLGLLLVSRRIAH